MSSIAPAGAISHGVTMAQWCLMNRICRGAAFALLLLAIGAAEAFAQRRCTKGIPCGNTCIAANRNCRVGADSTTSSGGIASQPTPAARVPEGMQFVASTQGRVYYFVGCSAWRSLSTANLRFFRTAAEAKAIELEPSTAVRGAPGPQARAAAPVAAVVAATTVPVTMTGTPGADCTVASITDGDTLACADGRRIRLLLIDAPEMSQGPFGALAKLHLEGLAPAGSVLRLEHDVAKQDRYGRELAYVYGKDGRMLNEELVRAGMAVVSVYPPNVLHVARLRAEADSAQAAKRGLWSSSAFDCSPADHRAGRCR